MNRHFEGRWALLLVSVATLAGCESTEAPEPPDLAEVEIENVLSLDFDEAPTLPSERGILTWDENAGMLAFVDRLVPHEIIVFSEDGGPVEVVGQRGDGPGEYEQIESMAFDRDGRLWVISQRGTRADRYTAQLELDDSFSLAEPVIAVRPLGDAPLVGVTGGPQGPDIAYLGDDGSLEPLDVGLPADADPRMVHVATDGTERYWVTIPHEFTILEGDARGSWSELDLEEPAWFAATYPPAIQEEFQEMLDTRGATILALEYQGEGDLLWITSGVPSTDVNANRLREVVESGDPERLGELVAMLVDHVVVGIDPGVGTSVAEGRFDFRAISERSGWQYEVADDHGTAVVQRPLLVR